MTVVLGGRSQSAVRLDDPSFIPAHLLKRLDAVSHLLRKAEFMDDLLKIPEFSAAAAQLDTHLLAQEIRAYHCTKQLRPGFFKERGLRPLSAGEHIEEFLSSVGPTLSPELLKRFESTYAQWQRDPSMPHREGLLWFCMSPYLVKNSGTSPFFTYYGGEALYAPFGDGDSCLEVLRNLGQPVVVEAVIPARDFKTYAKYPLAKDMLSHFARGLNPHFRINSLEAHVTCRIAPQEIVAAHSQEEFWKEYWPDLKTV